MVVAKPRGDGGGIVALKNSVCRCFGSLAITRLRRSVACVGVSDSPRACAYVGPSGAMAHALGAPLAAKEPR